MDDPHHIRRFTTRPTTLSPSVTWSIDGDTLVRERRGRSDTLAIHTLEEVRLWRAAMVPGTDLGGHLEAKLRLGGRWWRMSAHHAQGAGVAVDHSGALADVLTLALRARKGSPGVVRCRIGSQAQRAGAVFMFLVLVASMGAVGYGLHTGGMPKGRTAEIILLVSYLLVIGGILAACLRGGRYEHLTPDEMLRHPYIDPPQGSRGAFVRAENRLRDALDRVR